MRYYRTCYGEARLLDVHRIRTAVSHKSRFGVLYSVAKVFSLSLFGRGSTVVSVSQSRLLSVGSYYELASLLGLTEKMLCFYAFSGRRFYNSFEIPKKDGKWLRRIDAPHKNLRDIQRVLAEELSLIYTPIDAAYGFVRNRGIADNAYLHTRKRCTIVGCAETKCHAIVPVEGTNG